MDKYGIINTPISKISEQDEEQDFINKEKLNNLDEYDTEKTKLLSKDVEFSQINDIYDECLKYLKNENISEEFYSTDTVDPDYESIKDDEIESKSEDKSNCTENVDDKEKRKLLKVMTEPTMVYKIENELKSHVSQNSVTSEPRSERLRKLSLTLPKIIVTQSNSSLNVRRHDDVVVTHDWNLDLENFKGHEDNFEPENKITEPNKKKKSVINNKIRNRKSMYRVRPGYGDFPKRLVSKRGLENIALISNVPFEKIRLLNDTFHTLINLRWRWIVTGTIVVHFAIWFIFAIFWYITALAHYDFEPNPPTRTCITGGHDFLTIFLASVEAQTTIGFGDRAIDEECPESIFLFIMQLILGTGLSGVLTCVVYAKLTRPEKLSRDGVGFSKNAVLSMRDGKLCLMMRAWDLNYDHIISSELTAHFVHTHRSKEGEIIRYYAETLKLQQRQFLLWPVTIVHVIDKNSPLYNYGPEHITNSNYEITVSLKGASASMGTFTQSQTSYLPKEVMWGHRFPPVVRYDRRKQKYVIDHKKLDAVEPIDTPFCSAEEVYNSLKDRPEPPPSPGTPSSFSEKISSFQLGRSSSFRKKATNG